ncbi:hypothetical protein M3936_12755 [Sutcliffiella horikoshii]|nr:hypothetical protein [Sutcliffiella horikoshii]
MPLREQFEEGIILGGSNSGKRFAIAFQPVHKDRKKFASLHTYAIDTLETYYIETKINPKSAMMTIAKMLRELGVGVETPLLEIGEEVLV